MKKTLLIAILMTMTTFLSCTKNEIVNINQTDEIIFNAYTNSPTKAEIIDTKNFSEFNIYSYITADKYLGASDLGKAYINNSHYIKDDASKIWKHSDKYYWPINNEKIHFFAVSPLSNLISNYQTSINSYPSFDYTVEEKISTQKDLVISSLLNQTKYERDGNINLKFKHALSQINFSIKGEANNFKYKVTNIELLNIKNKGKFTFNSTEEFGTWNEQSGTAIYTLNLDNFIVDGIESKPLSKENETLILMPQKKTTNAKIKISYSIMQALTNTEIFKGDKEVDISSIIWDKNSNIRYTLTLPLDGNEITFDTEVSDWEDKTNKEFSVIKLNKGSITIMQTKTETLTANLSPKNTESSFIWTSNNESVATVDANGVITAIAKGNAIITVKALNTKKEILAKAECNVGVNDIINFKDKIFKSLLLNNPKVNIISDDEISINEAKNIRELDISNKNIESLEGIQYFENLSTFTCSNNPLLKSIDLSNNLNLFNLYCFSGISSVNLNNNTKLVEVIFYDTKLTSLDLSNNKNLISFRYIGDGITSLDISNNKKLNTFFYDGKGITSIDLSENKELTLLYFININLKTLDISNNENLGECICRETGLKTIDISNNKLLYNIDCSSTDISSLDISNNTALESINYIQTGITSLDVSNCENLTSLSCAFTGTSSIDVSKNTKLNTLICFNTKIESLDIKNNTELTRLNCINTEITSLDINKNTKLNSLKCSNTKIASLDISNNILLTELECDSYKNEKFNTIYVWKGFDKQNDEHFKIAPTINYVEKIN
ncbi:MAG: fimbrillin family protein [Bacteroidetes bacterium]|nr:fimbrillin family protein [Bacteroidota bacterium]